MRLVFGLCYLLLTRGLLVAIGITAIYAFASGPQGPIAPLWWGIAACSVGMMDDCL